MNQEQNQFCFCTLALGEKYRLLAQKLAEDLAKHSPGTFLVLYTDEPKDFNSHGNILAFKHQQEGILHCYHDKRLVMAKALSKFPSAICIDADTRILSHIPNDIEWTPGITAGHYENLIEHVNKYTPERLPHLENVASKLNLALEKINYIGESLFIITKDGGKEIEFFKYWGIIGRYLEFKGIHSGEGNAMGLAAAKVGWSVKTDGWEAIKEVTQHLDASSSRKQPTLWNKLSRKLAYHSRLNRARITALKDFDFFYR